jgi:hypothetical protein
MLCQVHDEPFDQATFERLIAEWVAACDQPFDEVEKVEYRRMMQYAARGCTARIPSADTVKRRIQDLGSNAVQDLKMMIAVNYPAKFKSQC